MQWWPFVLLGAVVLFFVLWLQLRQLKILNSSISLIETSETTYYITATLALLIGGIWTYNLFIKERRNFPHLNTKIDISHVSLSNDINLLHLGIELVNTGTAHLALRHGVVRIQQILPLLPCIKDETCAVKEINEALKNIVRSNDRFTWFLISERNIDLKEPLQIEPSEKHKSDYEFALSSDIKVVRIYVFFRNDNISDQRNEIGWSNSIYYKFDTSGSQ